MCRKNPLQRLLKAAQRPSSSSVSRASGSVSLFIFRYHKDLSKHRIPSVTSDPGFLGANTLKGPGLINRRSYSRCSVLVPVLVPGTFVCPSTFLSLVPTLVCLLFSFCSHFSWIFPLFIRSLTRWLMLTSSFALSQQTSQASCRTCQP